MAATVRCQLGNMNSPRHTSRIHVAKIPETSPIHLREFRWLRWNISLGPTVDGQTPAAMVKRRYSGYLECQLMQDFVHQP